MQGIQQKKKSSADDVRTLDMSNLNISYSLQIVLLLLLIGLDI